MKKQVYANLLILLVILCERISASSEGSINELSNLQIRKKRVIARTPDGHVPRTIREVPYIVNIQKNGDYECAGSILLSHVIITAAHCVEDHAVYHVLSGSSHVKYGRHHNILGFHPHPEYHRDLYPNDLAMLVIFPFIDFNSSHNRPIDLYNGYIPVGTHGIISSWGCNEIVEGEKKYPDELRSIVVRRTNQEACQRFYRPISPITDRDICIHDTSRGQCCSNGDSGAPLVIFDQLAGIMAWNGDQYGPDVFMNLSHLAYRTWINLNIPHYLDNPQYRHIF